jgi:endo-1,3-1,4-beta-glycanase ExoK
MMRIDIYRLLMPAILIFTPAAVFQANAQDGKGGGSSFVESFTAKDLRRWYISDGWTNGDHQGCTWSAGNVTAGGGALELRLRKEGGARATGPDGEAAPSQIYSCAELQTHEAYGYGTYEVRMRPAAGSGVVTAFFTYIGPRPGAPAPHDEIDFEFLGKDTRAVQLNYFGNGEGGHERMARLAFDAPGRMADYAFEWLPDSIRWFIDGELVHEARREAGKPFPATPSRILLSLWSAHGLDVWTGKFEYPGQPLVARYERVAFTKAGDPCQFPDSIVCKLAATAPAR